MKIYLEKIPLREYLYAAFILNLLVILFIVIVQKWLPPEVPIFYGLPQGESQLVPSLGLLIPSISSIFLIFINLLFINIIKDEFTKKTLVIAGLATAIFAMVTSVKIIFLVGQI